MKRKGGMNDSEGESHVQKWSNSPGYTNISNITNSPFKTPVSAKGGRTQKAKASKEGRSCPPTPISNAGEYISFYLYRSTTFSILFENA